LSDLTKLSDQDSLSENNGIITVEIKPKWGIICESIYIKNEHTAAKYHYCRYCMHQQLKYDQVMKLFLKKKSIETISDYCPMDLFSNNFERISKSIENLIENPQNNFKVFINHSEKQSSKIDQFIDRKSVIKKLTEILLETQILQEIQRIQLLDDLDIEIIETLFKKYSKSVHCVFENQIEDSWIQEIVEKLKKIQPKAYLCKSSSPIDIPTNEKKTQFFNLDLSEKEILQKIREYLISHTFKDCSVMITFSLKQESYKIGIVDLDSKLASKIPKYKKLDEEIVQNFVKKMKI
jgi:inositol-pentakisphosphate 2-kinase